MKKKWYEDDDYVNIIADLLDQPEVMELDNFVHHYYSTRLRHSLDVSYRSYLMAKKFHLDEVAAARAGLLHDMFYYNRKEADFKQEGGHSYVHPRIALRNAERVTELTPKEKDIIVKHMWGATKSFPRYKESYVVTLADKYSAIHDVAAPLYHKTKKKLTRKAPVTHHHSQKVKKVQTAS